MMDRRAFLKMSMAAAAGATGCRGLSSAPEPAGEIVGASVDFGHLLHVKAGFKQPQRPRRQVDTAILGSGIAGLSAAWKLERSGLDDFLILELESMAGGNSRYQVYAESRAPWAAHYLPVPTRESRAVQEVLAEMDLFLGFDAAGRPLYDERHLCHFPQERLFYQGRWEEGLYPEAGASPKDVEQRESFLQHVEYWKNWTDGQGRRAFAIPLDLSSPDPQLRALDQLSMDEYMDSHGWDSSRLCWAVDYGCRDDYGTRFQHTSAWAGLHYFSSRDAGGFETADAPFVWPEGNGRVTDHLVAAAGPRLETRVLVFRVTRSAESFDIDYLETRTGRVAGLTAKAVIYALPTFTRPFLLEEAKRPEFTYSPWLTANLVLQGPLNDPPGAGFPLAWDNVLYDSESLGYVVATHQSLTRKPGPTVLTWYRPLVGNPDEERRWLLGTRWGTWKDKILDDLRVVHPDIDRQVRRLDVMRLGHAMVRPVPGFIWGSARQDASLSQSGMYFAHSDLSGISIFEEAQYHGVRAAQEMMTERGHPFEDSLL